MSAAPGGGRSAAFDEAVQAQDRALAALGLAIWIGGEPTFTDRFSGEAEWIAEALGPTKEVRAQELVLALAATRPGAALLRSVGRQYPEEELPRFCYGLYARRDGIPAWTGPPDPLLGPPASAAGAAPLLAALEARLRARGASVVRLERERPPALGLLYAEAGGVIPAEAIEAARRAPSPHAGPIPRTGLRDELADAGYALVLLEDLPGPQPRALLPGLHEVPALLRLLEELGAAAREAGLGSLILAGHPPPVDASVAHETVTPDPAVIEVNMVPSADTAGFLAECRRVYRAAEAVGLSPYRLYWSGDATDSGGGGQLTIGGPGPEQSPFFVAPHLLPRLVAYLTRHPALSYLYAVDSIGSSSQAPRVDEGARESFEELALALHLLSRDPQPTPAVIWSSLAPFLTDRFGNAHRAELNIEKLWNPHLHRRGRLGLVELRALRMAVTPERAAALAALFRALCARLSAQPAGPALRDHGPALHDRFALPYFLRRDLDDVLADLEATGHGLAPAIRDELRDDSGQLLGRVAAAGVELSLRSALEFWPLVGDLSAQSATSRLIDPSSRRIELRLRAQRGDPGALARVKLAVDGYEVPLCEDRDGAGAVRVLGVRYRAFVPSAGLHPTLPAHGPLAIELHAEGAVLRVCLHDWIPGGGVYRGLPENLEEAARRRAERFVVEPILAPQPAPRPPPAAALRPYCLDTRYF